MENYDAVRTRIMRTGRKACLATQRSTGTEISKLDGVVVYIIPQCNRDMSKQVQFTNMSCSGPRCCCRRLPKARRAVGKAHEAAAAASVPRRQIKRPQSLEPTRQPGISHTILFPLHATSMRAIVLPASATRFDGRQACLFLVRRRHEGMYHPCEMIASRRTRGEWVV